MFTLKQTKPKKKQAKLSRKKPEDIEGKELDANRLMERKNNYNPVKTYILLYTSYDYILHSSEWAI